jgi:hypothetical protein
VCSAIACGADQGGEPVESSSAPSDATLEERPSGSTEASEVEAGSRPVSETGVCNNLLRGNDIPFAVAVFAVSDACPSQRRNAAPQPSSTVADVRREAPGKYCASGVVTDGFANLIVSFDHINDLPAPPFHGPLDAAALGVTQFRFSFESPPSTGLRVSPSNVVRDECAFSSDQCIQHGFYILNEAGAPSTITQTGTYTQRIADYRPGPGEPATLLLDMTRFSGFEFQLNPGEFNFCVSDVQLLDDGGNPVSQPE